MLYHTLVRPALFQLDAEKAHYAAFEALPLLTRPLIGPVLRAALGIDRAACHAPALARTVMGLPFANPVGLAAGFDKDARHVAAWDAIGFGHVEVGTLTPRPQPGNEKPRMFRLPPDGALLNRLGFNNGGAEVAALRLQKRPAGLIVGGNLGKNKDTANEEAATDYLRGFDALADVVDYLAINVSSPNTPGLRALQDRAPLQRLLGQIQARNQRRRVPRPLALKLAPDLTDEQLREAAALAVEAGLAGIIATNTTIARPDLRTPAATVATLGAGGLSGAPLTARALAVTRLLRAELPATVALIGVGGIMHVQDALDRLAAGADLLQLYTGFVYEGPALVTRICRALR
ncbi:MAG: quinone-dependent dihydroorotate dehydrogenase [Hymenobacteraceae bacterium]|nr:quinone-dependent dihydroorotate dehydrogenase [Hymenobacteraceae bacterium]